MAFLQFYGFITHYLISPWHRPPPPWCFASSQSFLQLWLPLVPLLRTLRTRTIAPRADVGSRTRTPLHWASRLREVDAAPRMPPDIWRDQVSVSLYQQLYGHADQELFSFFIGHYGAPLRLVLPYDWGNEAPCYQRPFEMTHYCPTSC